MQLPSFLAGIPVSFLCVSFANAAYYDLVKSYGPSNILDEFNFFTGDDPTKGFVQYVDGDTAVSLGLLNRGSDSFYVGVDDTIVYPDDSKGRPSVRLESKDKYTHGLFIFDLNHMPAGCGVWPAFWTVGPNWPSNGEIDIIEGVNDDPTNRVSLHTSDGCSFPPSVGQTGTVLKTDCNSGAGTDNTGCGSTMNDPANFGDSFNALGGGVYAMEWTSTNISIWFFPRDYIPYSILLGIPQPATWSAPAVTYESSGGCDIDQHFADHTIVIDTTLCGDYAGKAYGSATQCPQYAGLTPLQSCTQFVAGQPQALSEAYWSINSLSVYQLVDTPSLDADPAPLADDSTWGPLLFTEVPPIKTSAITWAAAEPTLPPIPLDVLPPEDNPEVPPFIVPDLPPPAGAWPTPPNTHQHLPVRPSVSSPPIPAIAKPAAMVAGELRGLDGSATNEFALPAAAAVPDDLSPIAETQSRPAVSSGFPASGEGATIEAILTSQLPTSSHLQQDPPIAVSPVPAPILHPPAAVPAVARPMVRPFGFPPDPRIGIAPLVINQTMNESMPAPLHSELAQGPQAHPSLGPPFRPGAETTFATVASPVLFDELVELPTEPPRSTVSTIPDFEEVAALISDLSTSALPSSISQPSTLDPAAPTDPVTTALLPAQLNAIETAVAGGEFVPILQPTPFIGQPPMREEIDADTDKDKVWKEKRKRNRLEKKNMRHLG